MAEKKARCLELSTALFEVKPGDTLELDEVWSFVRRRNDKRWLWTALCRRTRQIVAWVSGDHSAATCRKLWGAVPEGYKGCHTFSDFWDAYAKVLPQETHRSVGKESGETCHMERWNCTLRQRVGRFVRETLSFSKCDEMHEAVIGCFVHDYNLSCVSYT
jgi:insertion element IS1 protein InsB